MASVYLARAEGTPGFQKLVALKRIHSHLADEKDYVEMFLDEARIASRITHANVCSVFDFGEAEGECFSCFTSGDSGMGQDCTRSDAPAGRRGPG